MESPFENWIGPDEQASEQHERNDGQDQRSKARKLRSVAALAFDALHSGQVSKELPRGKHGEQPEHGQPPAKIQWAGELWPQHKECERAPEKQSGDLAGIVEQGDAQPE